MTCEFCELEVRYKGRWCQNHYRRFRLYGDPLGKPPLKPGSQSGSLNRNWKGDAAAYFTRHSRVKSERGSASSYLCEGCCGNVARDWAQVHDTNGLDIFNNYVPLCRHCHQIYDNIPQKRRKYRTGDVRGEKHGNAKLTESIVLQLRQRVADGETQSSLAREFGLLPGLVSQVILRERWKHI